MNEDKEVKSSTKGGISFIRLVPFLNKDFKKKLAVSIDAVKEHFVLNSEEAYETFWAVIKNDVDKDTPKKKKSWFR